MVNFALTDPDRNVTLLFPDFKKSTSFVARKDPLSALPDTNTSVDIKIVDIFVNYTLKTHIAFIILIADCHDSSDSPN